MERIKDFIASIGGRKTSFGLFIIILGSIIDVFTQKRLTSELQTLFISIYGLLVGGNIGEYFGKKKKDTLPEAK